jgi:DNA-binding NarL/FixJ family response regulator
MIVVPIPMAQTVQGFLPMGPMRVLIADDHPLYREAVQAQVERTFPGAETMLVGTVDAAIARLRAEPPIELVIVDLVMPGTTGASGVRRIVETARGAPVVVVSGTLEQNDVRACVTAGARAFVPKVTDPKVFASALSIVIAGGTYVPTEYLTAPDVPPAHEAGGTRPEPLTGRDIDMLRMLVGGRSNKEIARELGLQEVTVKVNLTRIFGRLGARNRAQAAAIAVELKLIPKPAPGADEPVRQT